MEPQDEEIKKSLEQHIRIANYVDSDYCDSVSVDLLQKTIELINQQQERIEELEMLTGLANNRQYYRKFVDEVFCKQKGNDLSEPDFDYIYQLYFEQQAEIENLKNTSIKNS